MRDVNNGWLIRYLHSNTASAFFFLVYFHMGRGLYYGSYRAPRTLVWILGTVIFILMIVTAFLGYKRSPKWSNKKLSKNLISRPFIRHYSTNSISNKSNDINNTIQDLGLNPVYIFDNLDKDTSRKDVLKRTSNLSGIYMILNKITKDYYIGSASTNRFHARFSNHLIYFRGALGSGISHLCLKLSNSGDTLKLLIPSHIWKYMSGWTNYSGKVTSQKMIEREIGNRGSKSAFNNVIYSGAAKLNNSLLLAVKEQRVDGSYVESNIFWSDPQNKSTLRCTLMGFERNYQLRILSNLINKPRLFSTLPSKITTLDPWFVTGLTDAEGCFTMSVGKNNKSSLGWAVKLSFQMGLHIKDRALLEQLQSYFKVGNISNHGSDMIHFRVESIKDLTKLINHFDSYPLITKKQAEFILFKKAYLIMLNKEHLTRDGLEKIIAIKSSLNKGLSNTLSLAFPNIAAIEKLSVIDIRISSPQWLAGFTTGEGCFYIKLVKSINSRQGFSVQLLFQLTQHTRDELLMRSLIDYLNSGTVIKDKDTYVFQVTKFLDITDKIIPFFKDYPVIGSKSEDYNDWLKVVELMKNKAHLTKEGLDSIRLIKAGMNRGRNLVE